MTFLNLFDIYVYLTCNLEELWYNLFIMTENLDFSKQMQLLMKLQDIDGDIFTLDFEKNSKPDEIAFLKEILDTKTAGLKEAEEALMSIQLKHKEEEVEFGAKEEEIKKLDSQLYQIKTNKEYTAMVTEIERHKADNSILEEEILGLMDKIDSAKKKVGEEKIKFADESKNIDDQIKEIENKIKEIESKISDLKAKRAEFAPLIDAKLLGVYERILNGRDGYALVEVINDACGGCHMQLPPQVIHQVKMKDKIIQCESCQRILYIKDEQSQTEES